MIVHHQDQSTVQENQGHWAHIGFQNLGFYR